MHYFSCRLPQLLYTCARSHSAHWRDSSSIAADTCQEGCVWQMLDREESRRWAQNCQRLFSWGRCGGWCGG